MASTGIQTTYQYRTLEAGEIRLLQILWNNNSPDNVPVPTYHIIHSALPRENEESKLQFEAISYPWGESLRVSALPIEDETSNGSEQVIGLTKNLTEALPYLLRNSTTNLLWIDQLCINQGQDDVALSERSIQVTRMSEIYSLASKVIVWTGPADEHSNLCKEYLGGLATFIQGYEDCERITPGTATYLADRRYVVVRSTFAESAPTDPKYATAIHGFWARPWFTRGWIVQEFLLGKAVVVLAGDTKFSLQDLFDMHTVPPPPGEKSHSWSVLMNLRLRPFNSAQPLYFLRLMNAAASQFETGYLSDRLYAFLGMLGGGSKLEFAPDYKESIRTNFTRFAAALARDYGSIDFLSMWSANLDEKLNGTPEELKGFPSWVPSWSAVPLTAPFRLAVGGVRAVGNDIGWNAAGGRRHVHESPDETILSKNNVAAADCMVVKGMIIDSIDVICTDVGFTRYWDFSPEIADEDNKYFDGLVEKIKAKLGGLDHWTRADMLQFLDTVAANGITQQLGTDKKFPWKEFNSMAGYDQRLGLSLSVGRGRRFARTKGRDAKGRLGLVPVIGSQVGSVIAILQGCSVPIVLEAVDEESGMYKVVGDCYIEGVMLGEAVDWAEKKAQRFVLV